MEVCNKYPKNDFLILIFPNDTPQEVKAISFLKEKYGPNLKNAKFLYFKNRFSQGTFNLILFNLFLLLRFKNIKFDLFSTSGGVKGRLVLKYIRYNQLLITDEGIGSLKRFPEMFRDNRIFPLPESPVFKRLYNFFGINDIKTFEKFSIFTMYQELESLSEIIAVNNFEFTQKLIAEDKFKLNHNEVIILGTNPKGFGKKEEDYSAVLQDSVKKFNGYKILLKPHKTYRKTFNFEELKADLPIEYFFLSRKALPQHMVSFNSTSNRVLANLFPEIKIHNIQL